MLKWFWTIFWLDAPDQPAPQALRFLHGRSECETLMTGDEPQGTMGRVHPGSLPFTKIFPKIRLESKWNTTLWVVLSENFREQQNIWKGGPVFSGRNIPNWIRVPYLQSHLWNRVQAFAVVFGKWNWFVQMVNAIPGRNLPGLNFAYIYGRLLVRTKHFPESKNTSQNPKHVPEFWEIFLDSGKCFRFWEVFLYSGTCFGKFWEVCLDSGKCFAVWEVFCPYEPPYGPTGLPV